MDSRYNTNGRETLLHKVKKQKVSYYGHVLRKSSCMEQIIQGCRSAIGQEADSDGDGLRISVIGLGWRTTTRQESRTTERDGIMFYSPPTLVAKGNRRRRWRRIVFYVSDLNEKKQSEITKPQRTTYIAQFSEQRTVVPPGESGWNARLLVGIQRFLSVSPWFFTIWTNWLPPGQHNANYLWPLLWTHHAESEKQPISWRMIQASSTKWALN